MASNYSKNKVMLSLFWKLMERGGTQGIQFLVQIVLARLISPEEFGTISLVMVFINLAQVFVQSGFNTALIQKRDADEKDFSSIFYLSLFIAGILYIILYLTAPAIADFYGNDILTPVLRALGLILFTGAFNSIQNAYVARNLLFKKLFKSSLGAIVLSGVLGIVAAYQGLGVWALVIQQIVNQVGITIIMWFTVKWRPHLIFSLERVKQLFNFGSKLLASSLLDTLYLDIRTLLIGRIYSASALGYYNRGEQFPKLIVSNINGAIQSVMLPTLSSFQDDKDRIKRMMRRSIVTSSFLVFPMMIGILAIAGPLVSVVLTDKWLPSVPFVRIFCVSYMFMPIHTANLQAINAIGRSDIFLKLEVIKKTLGLIILGVSLPFGVYGIAIGQVMSNIVASFVNAYPSKKLLNYSYSEQLFDLFPSLMLSFMMGGVVYLVSYLPISMLPMLLLQTIVGFIIYLVLSLLTKNESFNYLLTTIKSLKNKN